MSKILYVGIDQSINSSGLAFRTDDGYLKFYQITPGPVKHSPTVQNVTYKKEASTEYSVSDLMKVKNGFRLGKTFLKLIERHKELTCATKVYLAMEGAVMSFGFKKSQARLNDLIAYNTMIKFALITADYDRYEVVAPSALKKLFTGKGNCKKEAMIEKFLQEVPDFVNEYKIDDIADAYALTKIFEHKQYKDV